MNLGFLRSSKRPALLLGTVIVTAVVVWGCSNQPTTTAPEDTNLTTNQSVMQLGLNSPAILAAIQVQESHTPAMFAIDGVVGTAVGADNGKPVITIYTETKLSPGIIPAVLDGYRVVQVVSGPIVAFKGPPGGTPGGGGGGGGVSHTAIQDPPVQLGTSGGPANDLANGYCCGGTLGSLIQIGGTQYILSNSHVFAGDVVPGGNGSTSKIGDDITQPGLIDVGCIASQAQVVADLSSLSTLYPPNSTPNVDAAIAQVRAGMVDPSGAILEIGPLSPQTVAASVGQKVKKSGRTSGLSRSTIDGLNATVNVGYSDECAGGSFTKQFTGQIVIKNRGSKFLAAGDSGSLMVEDVSNNPRAVGLLYAGSSTIAVANPIDDVLNHFGASMVGN